MHGNDESCHHRRSPHRRTSVLAGVGATKEKRPRHRTKIAQTKKKSPGRTGARPGRKSVSHTRRPPAAPCRIYSGRSLVSVKQKPQPIGLAGAEFDALVKRLFSPNAQRQSTNYRARACGSNPRTSISEHSVCDLSHVEALYHLASELGANLGVTTEGTVASYERELEMLA
jgi:hypothetical protein